MIFSDWDTVLKDMNKFRYQRFMCTVLGLQLNKDTRTRLTLCTISLQPEDYIIQMRARLIPTHSNKFENSIKYYMKILFIHVYSI